MELMAPAGNIHSFIAAIEAGADSVYLGLKKYNARYPAENFDTFQLIKAVEFAHSKNRKVYLTLNIDLKSNEIEDVCKILSFCEKIKIDAVIVKDPAIIFIYNKFFKGKFDLHLSTQSAVCSSFGVKFAKELNIKRVVLARELTLQEIKKCCEIEDMEIEVFVQGSMCFSISGRCLMSSYVGGKSGNRGRCTAPCRVQWESNGEKMSFFSMKDLCLINILKELEEIGVSSLKIEGRLKDHNWVREVTLIYRKALDSKEVDFDNLKQNLLKFSARDLHSGHIFGHNNLIQRNPIWDNFQKKEKEEIQIDNFEKNFCIIFEKINNTAIKISIVIENNKEMFDIEIATEKKKAKLQNFILIKDEIKNNNIIDKEFDIQFVNCDDILVTSSFIKKTAQKINRKIASFYNKIEDFFYKTEEKIIEFIKPVINRDRKRLLGDYPNKIILNHNQLNLIKEINGIDTIVVYIDENPNIDLLKFIKDKYKVIIAIPEVLFEDRALKIQKIVNELKQKGFNEFEANSFTGLYILNSFDCIKHLGIGLPLYNHISVRFYKNLGCQSFYSPIEGDISIYKSLSTFSEIKVEIIVFSMPQLFITRVQSPYFKNKNIFSDKYSKIICFENRETKSFVPVEPVSFIGETFKKDEILVDNLVADLRFFENPESTLRDIFNNKFFNKKENSFNYFRKLS